ncbi:hypothetical protein GCK72_020016 [Caenorhabditis remanei]|uniref:Uncharacterized protein n=1 Tax=Caenorhabditis remanei TaxID=31234 RepID=A0A6A5GGC6_CAERE|nr:hypothetical protein GCK72_020016 [Caenorhabditis remanei]KAF1753459.1 hypothetical protein GCK72_020016 [Caenorhabditis remanei]
MNSTLELPQYLELAGSALSLFFNVILFYIITKFSRPEYGSYRILMLVMTSLYVVYSAIEVIVLPSYFVFEYNYFLFTTNFIEYQVISQVLIVTFCAVFGCMQVVLAAQFIYRFLSVAGYNYLREKYFKGRRHTVWVFSTVIFFINWFVVAWLIFGNRGDHPRELAIAVEDRFGRNISDMAFTLVTYASIPMTISLFCGIKTWLKIQFTISLAAKSRHLQRQERQLFFALLTQFSIPFLGNTVPMLIVFLCPAFHVSTEPYTNYICMLVPFYPVFDAVATTLIIKDYYRGVLKLLGFSPHSQNSSLSNGGAIPPPNSLFIKGSSAISMEIGSIQMNRLDSQL